MVNAPVLACTTQASQMPRKPPGAPATRRPWNRPHRKAHPLGDLREPPPSIAPVEWIGQSRVIPFAAFLGPPLTTVSVPEEELGRQARAMLHRQMQDGQIAAEQRLPSSLVVRGSTAPPRH